MSSKDFATAMKGNATALAKLGAEAFEKGRLVEAVYWMVMADLRGFQNLAPIIAGYVEAWRALDCPAESEKTHEFFSEEQRQFGHAALLWLSNVDRVFARNWFSRASCAGNYDARDFMMHNCSQ